MSDVNAVCTELLRFNCAKLEAMTGHVRSCLGKLTEEQVWEKYGPHENAVANLMLHLCGNARQWVLHGVRGDADVRVREEEFSTVGGMSKAGLMGLFAGTMGEVGEVIGAVEPARLLETIHPQDRTVTVLEAISQVVGHVQQHVGQIILLTKQMVGTDIDLVMPRKR